MAGCGLGAGGGCDEHGAAVAAVGIESDYGGLALACQDAALAETLRRDLKCVRLLAGPSQYSRSANIEDGALEVAMCYLRPATRRGVTSMRLPRRWQGNRWAEQKVLRIRHRAAGIIVEAGSAPASSFGACVWACEGSRECCSADMANHREYCGLLKYRAGAGRRRWRFPQGK